MTSLGLIQFLEEQFVLLGVSKVVPDKAFLGDSYCRQLRLAVAEKAAQDALREFDVSRIVVPDDLDTRIVAALFRQPESHWESPLNDIARADARRLLGDRSKK